VLLDRRAPIRESYTLAPEDTERQRQIIRELAAGDVRWIVVNDLADKSPPDRVQLPEDHPLVWQHILANYAPSHWPARQDLPCVSRAPTAEARRLIGSAISFVNALSGTCGL